MAPMRPWTPDFAKLTAEAALVTLRGGRPVPGSPRRGPGPRPN